MFEGKYFYHESTRRVTIAFGSLFNSININRKRDGVDNLLKVGISTAPREHFITKLNKTSDDEKYSQILPRMSFEVGTPVYDAERESDHLQKMCHNTDDGIKYQYSPVPYTFPVTLNIWVKYLDDRAQIIEQILPYFRPDFTVSIKDIAGLDQVTDLKIRLASISDQDTYESNLADKRLINTTLEFDVEYFLFPPVEDGKLIRQAIVNMLPNTIDQAKDTVTVTLDPFFVDPDDPFSITEIYN